MKRNLTILAALLLVCSSAFAQKVNIQAEKPEDHMLSVMSFNIRHGKGMDGQVDLARIAKEISLVGADVVALQEVDRGTKRIGGVDSPSRIAELAGGYYASFASAMDYDGGQYGNAIISKKQPLAISSVSLPGKEEPRVVLVAEFDGFYFCSIHLSLDSLSRIESCRMLADIAKKITKGNFRQNGEKVFSGKDKPFYICGDFNLVPSSLEMRVLAESFGIISAYQIHTFPSDKPNRTLDYIAVYKGGEGGKLLKKLEQGKLGVASWVQPEKVASDHRPVVAVISKSEDFVTKPVE